MGCIADACGHGCWWNMFIHDGYTVGLGIFKCNFYVNFLEIMIATMPDKCVKLFPALVLVTSSVS